MSRRLTFIAPLATALALALAGTASAASTVARDTGWVSVGAGTQNSDCSIRAQLLNDSSAGIVQGRGSAFCSKAKSQVAVTQTIKATASDGTVYTYNSPFTPLANPSAPPWVYSPNFQNGCYKWQTVTNIRIVGPSQTTSYYITSGAPLKFNDHCPF